MADKDVVCDTTVLLYLDRIGQANLLSALFASVYVPVTVLLELDMGLYWDVLDIAGEAPIL